MNKDEILERNKKCSNDEGDEREQYISGKAGINAKLVFSFIIAIFAMLKRYRGMPTDDVWAIFTAYVATESWYRYHYLGHKKLLLSGTIFSIAFIYFFVQFIILIYR